jgi:hypothetical protein
MVILMHLTEEYRQDGFMIYTRLSFPKKEYSALRAADNVSDRARYHINKASDLTVPN